MALTLSFFSKDNDKNINIVKDEETREIFVNKKCLAQIGKVILESLVPKATLK